MPTQETSPAAGARTELGNAFPGGNCNSETAPKTHIAQEKIEQIFDDIGPNINAMGAMLNAAVAMHEAGDPVGLIYALRRVRSYWVAVSELAKELVAADAERLSALRQEGARQ